jgi:hypothetical protein
MNVYSTDPGTAFVQIQPYLSHLVASSFEHSASVGQLAKIKTGLDFYVPNSPWSGGLRLSFPHYHVDFGVGPTFIPSSKVSYFCMITLPHFDGLRQFTPLPRITNPEALIDECRPLIPGFYEAAEKIIPSQEWPVAVASLRPTKVYAHETTLYIVFDRHPGVGSHCLAVSGSDRLIDSGFVTVVSTITPGLYEVRSHY